MFTLKYCAFQFVPLFVYRDFLSFSGVCVCVAETPTFNHFRDVILLAV